MDYKPYTLVGSRQTPEPVLAKMYEIAEDLYYKGYIARSGGADGADSAVIVGCRTPQYEIYTPWQGFNGCRSQTWENGSFISHETAPGCFRIAESYIPHWNNCNDAAKKLHARNVHQVLGKDLASPSLFMVCWTQDGKLVGGTRTAIVIARDYGIPICNLAVDNWEDFYATHIR